jgi:hypothetical protein
MEIDRYCKETKANADDLRFGFTQTTGLKQP